MQKNKIWTKRLFSAGMALCMTLCAALPAGAESAGKLADAATYNNYTSTLGEADSTLYNGRVWSDKTVSTDSITFTGTVPGENGASQNVSYTYDTEENEDFLVTFSTLATSTEVTHLPKIPVDVVYVLDFSASMTWGTDATTVVDEKNSRIAALVKALNESIYQLQQDNPDNRVGVVYFNRIGNEWMGLQKLDMETPEDKDGDGIPDYFSIQSFTGTPGGDKGEATVVCNFGTAKDQTATTDSKTNIQFGLNVGMRMLTEAENTTFTPNGSNNIYTRIPNIVLMSDGAPTTISLPQTDGEWWGPLEIVMTTTGEGDNKKEFEDSYSYGDNKDPWSANGFMAMATAQYLKEKITDHYQQAAIDQDAKNQDQAQAAFYTIGFSVNQQTDGMVALANLVLNPAENWDKADSTGTMSEDNKKQLEEIRTAWGSFADGQEAEVTYRKNVKGENQKEEVESLKYQVQIPSGWTAPTQPDYVDAYYAADDADQLSEAFRTIISEITESAKAPTEVENNDPVHSGCITYTDPIGKYMEVKSIKALLYAGEDFTEYSEVTQGNVTTYTFTGTIDSEVYGQQDVSEIKITVTKNADGTETLKVEVPAAAIPLRVNEVEINEDGTVKSNTYNDAAYPLRLIYSVGRTDNADVLLACDTAYQKNHAAGDGTFYLYSNQYQGDGYIYDASRTVGDATVTFQPAENNPFYFLQEDTPLYTDENCKNRATDTLDESKDYYFQIEYYDGMEIKTASIRRSGSTLKNYTITGADGLYLQKGAPRLNNLTDLAVNKTEGGTVTDACVLATEASKDSGSWVMTSHLGNNGRVPVAPADLKTVTGQNGSDLDGQTVQPGQELTYTIAYGNSTDAAQTITITDTLPEGTAYLENSASGGGVYDAQTGTLTWTLTDVAPGTTDTVSFQVTVTDAALQPGKVENSAAITIGTNSVTTNTVTVLVKAPTPAPTETPDGGTETTTTTTTTTTATATPTPTPAATAQPTEAETTSAEVTIPQTGDSSHPEWWAGLMGISAVGFVVLLALRKKHF